MQEREGVREDGSKPVLCSRFGLWAVLLTKIAKIEATFDHFLD